MWAGPIDGGFVSGLGVAKGIGFGFAGVCFLDNGSKNNNDAELQNVRHLGT